QQGAQHLAELTAQLETSTGLQPLCAAWDGYRPRLQQAVQLAARLQQGRTELPGLEQRAQTAEAEQNQARASLDELQRQLGSEAGPGEQLARLNQQLAQWRQAERDVEALQTAWSSQQNLLARQAELQRECSRLQAEQENLIPAGKQARSERDAAEQALKITLDLLERQRLARSENVEALRAALVPGEPCPVCGSGEHPWHQADALPAAFEQQDESEAERARQALQAQALPQQELRDHPPVRATGLNQAQQRQQEVAAGLDALAPRLSASLLAQPDAERAGWLSAELSTLGERIAGAIQRQNVLLELQQRSEALQQGWQTAREACVQAAQQLAQQRDALARDNQRLEEELAAFAGLLTDAQLLHWRENPAQTFMALDGEITTRLQQLQAQAEQVEEQRQRQEKIQALALEQQHLQEKQTACAARLAD